MLVYYRLVGNIEKDDSNVWNRWNGNVRQICLDYW